MLFQTRGREFDDLIEGNYPRIPRNKVPKKLLYFLMYCQSLQFAEEPAYRSCIIFSAKFK